MFARLNQYAAACSIDRAATRTTIIKKKKQTNNANHTLDCIILSSPNGTPVNEHEHLYDFARMRLPRSETDAPHSET